MNPANDNRPVMPDDVWKRAEELRANASLVAEFVRLYGRLPHAQG
jgi:hypothetical protein